MDNIQDLGLPDTLFLCRIPIIATYSEEEAVIFGLPLDSINGHYNDKTYTKMTNVMISIDKMINLYSMGYPITIINYKDSKEIFTILDTYLNNQVNKIQMSINQPIKEDSRLNEIDKFLTEMFDFNRKTIVAGMINTNTGFDLGLGLMGGSNGVTNAPLQLDATNDSKPSIAAAYTHSDKPNDNIYIQPNQLRIDMDTVKRERIVKPKSGTINEAFLNR